MRLAQVLPAPPPGSGALEWVLWVAFGALGLLGLAYGAATRGEIAHLRDQLRGYQAEHKAVTQALGESYQRVREATERAIELAKELAELYERHDRTSGPGSRRRKRPEGGT